VTIAFKIDSPLPGRGRWALTFNSGLTIWSPADHPVEPSGRGLSYPPGSLRRMSKNFVRAKRSLLLPQKILQPGFSWLKGKA